MKKIGYIAGTILVLIIIGIILINGNEKETEVTKNQTKVGFIFNGSREDNSWGTSHYQGMEKSAEALNLHVIYKEHVPEDESCKKVMEELITEGCEIIICNSFGYGEYELEIAEKYPDIYFFHATGTETADNLTTYFGRIYQMRYLSGIVAGLQTKTNEIGYVAAFPISEVNRGINAFTLGVRAVNKDAVVHVEWSESWTGEEEAAKATNELLNTYDIDVLTIHVNSNKPLFIAEQRGVWTIGYNVDNSKLYPDTFLTAAVWNWEKFYEPSILECLQGKFQGKSYWQGVDTGLVSLSPLTKNVKEGIKEVVEKEKQRLQSGTFDVFYGPIKDTEGNIRIKEGESMSDEAMLNAFDWYVEGVEIDDKE